MQNTTGHMYFTAKNKTGLKISGNTGSEHRKIDIPL